MGVHSAHDPRRTGCRGYAPWHDDWRRSLLPGSEHVRASTSWTYCNGDGYGGLGYELSYQTVDIVEDFVYL